ncbi:hypothetical protein DE146DRAFT_645062 [Phaeosphaeria sp. MPI-PUGE-AT-0046c]|nr:hypothetical protein DE146DRAFT_645062 [Phaeosphaeria sp. MPI-PUGE-AT-0046c]
MAYSHLLSLPRELRDIIFEHAVPKRIELIHSSYEENVNFFNNNGILLANQQLRNEAIEAVYRGPYTTIIWSRKSRIPFLVCPDYLRLRQNVQKLVLRTEYRKLARTRHILALRRNECLDDGLSLMHIIQCMPALREIVCEISWTPCVTASVLLPNAKEIMTAQLRRATIGGEEVVGWELEDRIVDSTRWMKNWSGLLIARKS